MNRFTLFEELLWTHVCELRITAHVKIKRHRQNVYRKDASAERILTQFNMADL